MDLVIKSGQPRISTEHDISAIAALKNAKSTQSQAAENSEMLTIKQGNRVVLEAPLANLDPSQTAKLTQLLESIDSEAFKNNLGTAVNLVQHALSEFLNSVNGPQQTNSASKGALSDIFELMALLFQLAKDNRELNITQRDIATTASVASIKAQASELRSAKSALIAMAVVSGVLTIASAVLGAYSAKNSVKDLNESGKVNKQLADQHKFKDALKGLQGEGKNVSSALRGTKAEVGTLQVKSSSLDNTLKARDSRSQLTNTVLQGVGQVSTNIGNVFQTEAQASQKEEEAEGTLKQAEKQKADDRIGYDDNFLKEVRDILRAIGDSYNQAWKAASTPS